MGSTSGGRDEKPVHFVTLSSFYLGKYEVTQEQWTAVMHSNPQQVQRARPPGEVGELARCRGVLQSPVPDGGARAMLRRPRQVGVLRLLEERVPSSYGGGVGVCGEGRELLARLPVRRAERRRLAGVVPRQLRWRHTPRGMQAARRARDP
jgi:hypothetical protein